MEKTASRTQQPETLKPRIVVSKCLGFDACRYNGEKLKDDFLENLQPFVDYVFVCPEVEIGLGVPRDPIRLVSQSRDKERPQLVQPATGRDVTGEMSDFSARFLKGLSRIDGFVLKGKSPSCAIKDAKLYSHPESGPAFARGPGLFGAEVLKGFPGAAVEDEGRLKNLHLREHFLTRVFTSARFRRLMESSRIADLVEFHSRHKMLLMAYHQEEMRHLGRLVANPHKLPAAQIFPEYGEGLSRAFRQPPRYNSNINVLMHAFGYVSKELGSSEKAHFLDTLDRFRQKQVPLVVPATLLGSWIRRFRVEYLASQLYFEPFPVELVTPRDSGRGRPVR